METLKNARTYFAVQTYKGENPDILAKLICEAARRARTDFQGLEYLSTDAIGTTPYARFRTDLADATVLLDRLLEAGRGVVRRQSGTFMLKTPDGRHGIVPGERMFSVARNGRVYRGTAMKLWEEQFAAN